MNSNHIEIEFNGYLTGSTYQYYHKRSRILGRNIMLITAAIMFPGMVSLALTTKYYVFFGVYGLLVLLLPLATLIPKRKLEAMAITPKRIYIEDEYIVCVTDRFSESKLIEDVKCVREFDEFYEMIFPFGKVSEKFVCQKSLLTKGSLEEFEALFAGKINRV